MSIDSFLRSEQHANDSLLPRDRRLQANRPFWESPLRFEVGEYNRGWKRGAGFRRCASIESESLSQRGFAQKSIETDCGSDPLPFRGLAPFVRGTIKLSESTRL